MTKHIKHVLLVHDGETMRCVANDAIDTDAFGPSTRRRATHIWPKHPVKRAAFRLLRWVCGDRGRVAAWTRGWYGPWICVLADDPSLVLFGAQSRNACLAWEHNAVTAKLSAGDLF